MGSSWDLLPDEIKATTVATKERNPAFTYMGDDDEHAALLLQAGCSLDDYAARLSIENFINDRFAGGDPMCVDIDVARIASFMAETNTIRRVRPQSDILRKAAAILWEIHGRLSWESNFNPLYLDLAAAVKALASDINPAYPASAAPSKAENARPHSS